MWRFRIETDREFTADHVVTAVNVVPRSGLTHHRERVMSASLEECLAIMCGERSGRWT
ncbi:hypothetical protein [Lentzea sp. NEAU-D7]|uniref:hypothetical protein n=1 Tax=Lentzea sp. NEAU-D7 TaxID=2994667 RepID=UPI00224A6408|nr:hypothetical protein [Lentzea sp. NEAU-D7]MCX2954547.1 hypothetical protein [Lentzea sp. NEAU-D7]